MKGTRGERLKSTCGAKTLAPKPHILYPVHTQLLSIGTCAYVRIQPAISVDSNVSLR